ncbi:6-carboxytetrahydropterin synthase QueD [Paenibacillus sp. ClWae2A]|uniref:6-carboxytetrahydropterin synthase QueD n=1 Tax=Paenibacillus sp. ClWae2A TaxID=3057177 RepID=UPI0028F57379|nr:6-carboxytetrahydropterin synthase QueD [Paenibacillus sp. ClWae2A]MDT9722283.1 6-carboxytetrahydropterin synthase QueD [Paenibacillus sp. ClWae2A]
MKNEINVCKIFQFDAAHQLIGHNGKCANVHGHTYKLEVVIRGTTYGSEDVSNEGFVMDFSDLKKIVNEVIIDKFDHAFLAAGNEPVLQTLKSTGSKVCIVGCRTTAENMSKYICFELIKANLPVWSIKLWETSTSWVEVFASDIDHEGPFYAQSGVCDYE